MNPQPIETMNIQPSVPMILASLMSFPLSIRSAELGDPAAPLDIAEWVRGDAVDLADVQGDKIVVVEFWATWCGPCLTSIPHLTELQHKFADRGVVVIGVSAEDPSTVRPFLDRMGAKMDYTVAVDNNRQTSKGYMTAYGQNGIPHAFIIDLEGRIAWHGHPMSGLDQVLDRIAPAVAVEKPKDDKRAQAQHKLQQFIELSMRGGDTDSLTELAAELTALDRELDGIHPGRPLNLAELQRTVRFQSLMRDYQRAVAAGESEAALTRIEKEAAPLAPPGFQFDAYRGNFSLQRIFQDYYRAVTRGGDTAAIPALTARLEAVESSDAESLNEIAWTLLTDEAIKTRNPALALKLAQSAFDQTKGEDADVIDTYARALFANGRVAEAVKQQERAIALTRDRAQQSDMQASLKRYQAALQ